MEEAEEFEVYDELETEASNSLRGDAGMNEPNFDELTSDNLPVDSRSIDRTLDESSLGQYNNIGSNGSKDPEGPKSPKNDEAFRETDDNPSQDTPLRGSSPSVELNVASEVGTKKYQWPKLYKLPSELRYPVPEDQQEAVKFKLGSFYMRVPHICRLRLSENCWNFRCDLVGNLRIHPALVDSGDSGYLTFLPPFPSSEVPTY